MKMAFKYRMSSLQAAFGLAQSERIDELLGQVCDRPRDIITDESASSELPTRERAETLRHALRTCIGQGFDDHEIIVHDNCGSLVRHGKS